ncbi:hypothetical protein PGQ11_006024 [Apiospora arundinis]|uniref:Uncharacterized protein n=1 Tax=Apiospora arundinis TaxID=335852 RepID=A0ABR2ISW6_9PEZI
MTSGHSSRSIWTTPGYQQRGDGDENARQLLISAVTGANTGRSICQLQLLRPFHGTRRTVSDGGTIVDIIVPGKTP